MRSRSLKSVPWKWNQHALLHCSHLNSGLCSRCTCLTSCGLVLNAAPHCAQLLLSSFSQISEINLVVFWGTFFFFVDFLFFINVLVDVSLSLFSSPQAAVVVSSSHLTRTSSGSSILLSISSFISPTKFSIEVFFACSASVMSSLLTYPSLSLTTSLLSLTTS